MSELPEKDPAEELADRPTFREIAREEFWIVAKSFFAPIYGTFIVWRELLRLTRRVDRKAFNRNLASAAEEPWPTPAE